MKKRIKIHELMFEFFDWMQVFMFVFILLVFSLLVVYYIMKNYVDVDSFLAGNLHSKTVYILDDVDNEKYIPYLKKNIKDFRIATIKAGALANINKVKKQSVLLVINAQNVPQKTKLLIEEYIKKGGSVVFNYATDDLVKSITTLDMKDRGVLNRGTFIIQSPILSTLQTDKQKIKLYDNIYIYKNKAVLELTRDYKSYGIVWYGNYAKGTWVYSSVPFYILKESHALEEMIRYAYFGFKAEKYPYLDVANPVLINEYFYYEFNYNLINLVNDLGLKATLFINPDVLHKKLKIGNNIEIASSVLDKHKIGKFYKYTNQTILGYSNENFKVTRKSIIHLYKDLNFLYTFNENVLNNHVYYNNFVEFAESGFNDMSLISDFDKIKHIIDFETKYGSFVLTIHPYLLGYKDNLELLEKILTYMKKYKTLTAKEAYHKYLVSSKIFYSFDRIENGIILKIKNNSLEDVKNLTFRIYSQERFKKLESNLLNLKAKIINQHENYFDVRIKLIRKNAEFFLRIER